MAQRALVTANLLETAGVSARVVDMRFVKPLDNLEVKAAADTSLVVTMEDGILAGGFGSAVLESLSRQGLVVPTLTLGVDDTFVAAGGVDQLLDSLGLSPEAMSKAILSARGALAHVRPQDAGGHPSRGEGLL